MTIDNKVSTLGKFLNQRFGGKVMGDVADALAGCCEVDLQDVPRKISVPQLYDAITQFYEQIGFKRDTESQLETPVYYKGNRGDNVRFLVLSDNRDPGHSGSILITVAPLYCTTTK